MRTLACFIIAVLVAPTAAAADKSSGCGAGWYVTERLSLSATSTRGTTHGVLPPTFSMTSGTSGCAKHSIVLRERRSEHLVEANYDRFREEAAAGHGELLQAFLATAGCDAGAPEPQRLLQQNYGAIMGDSSLQPSAVTARAHAVLRLGAVAACPAV